MARKSTETLTGILQREQLLSLYGNSAIGGVYTHELIPHNMHADSSYWNADPLDYNLRGDFADGANFFTHYAFARPDLKEAPEVSTLQMMNLSRQDRDLTGAQFSAFFTKRAGAGHLDAGQLKWARLKNSSAATASELMSGQAPSSAFYVFTDSQENAPKIARGIPYWLNVTEENGHYSVMAAPHRLAGPGEGDIVNVSFASREAAQAYLDRWVRPGGSDGATSRVARAQIMRVAHDRAVRNIYERLTNPLELRAMLQTAPGTSFFKSMPRSGVNRTLQRYQQAIMQRVLDPLRANPGMALGVLDKFENYVRSSTAAGGYTAADVDRIMREEWRMIVNPVLAQVTRPARWAVNPAQNGQLLKMLNVKMLRSNRGGDHIANLLLKRAQTLGILEGQGAFRGLIGNRNNQVDVIKHFLGRLDLMEKAQLAADPSLPQYGMKRVKAFERELSRWTGGKMAMLDRYNAAHPENPLELRLRLQHDKAGKGMGVLFTAAPKGANEVRVGDPNVVQAFFPIADERGYFHSEGGREFVGRALAVDQRAIDQSTAAYYLSKTSMLSQGFRLMTNQAEVFKDATGKSLLFSPQQALVAAGDLSREDALHAMNRGDFSRASELLAGNARIYTMQKTLNTAQQVDKTMAHWPYRRSVSTPEVFNEDFTDIRSIKSENLDVDKVINLLRGNLPNHARNPINLRQVQHFEKTVRKELEAWAAEQRTLNPGRKLNLEDEDTLRWAIGSIAGRKTGFAAKIRRENALNLIERIPWLTAFGREAPADYMPYSTMISRYSLPGGITRLRPHQLMKNIKLGATSDVVAGTRLWGYEAMPDIATPERWRNVHAGVAFSAQELDAAGNPVGRVLSGEEMMEIGKFFEQQVIAKPELAGAFGMRTVNNLKLDFDTTKGTILEAGRGNTLDFEHRAIQALIGVDGKKLLDKHDSMMMFTRGWTNRLLAEAGADSDFVQERLRALYGADTVFRTENGMLSMYTNPGSTLIPKLEELAQVFQDLNARRQAQGRANEIARQFDSLTFHAADGRRFRVDVAHLLLPTSILSDTDPSTSLKASEIGKWWGKYRPLKTSTLRAATDAIMLERIRLAGAPAFANMIETASWLHKGRTGVIRRVAQAMGAFGGTFGLAKKHVDQREFYHYMRDNGMVTNVSMDDMIRAGRDQRAPDLMMRDEYIARYGTGMQELALHQPVKMKGRTVDRIVMPDELAAPEDGGYRPTSLQQSADRVIAANADVINGVENGPQRLQKAVERYHDDLLKAGGGKEGYADAMLREVSISGQGVSQAKLGYNPMMGMTYEQINAIREQHGLSRLEGEGQYFRQGDTLISRAVAENMGLVDPEVARDGLRRAKGGLADWRAANDARGFAYGGIIRSPSVQQGGFLTRFVFDPLHGTPYQMDSGKAFVSEMWRDPANADFDGDAAALIAAGYTGEAKPDAEAISLMESQIEAQQQYYNEIFAKRERAKAKMRELDEAKAITDDMLGMEKIRKILDAKDIGRDYFNMPGLSQDELRAAERLYRAQRDTALTQGLIGSLTDPLQHVAMQQAFLANDELGRRVWEDIYSNFGVMREGVLKVKSNKAINSHAIRAGLIGDPKYFEDEVMKSFVHPAELKGDAVEAARYRQLVDFVNMMHANFGDGWFDKIIKPQIGDAAAAVRSESEGAWTKTADQLTRIFTGDAIAETEPGVVDATLRYAQSHIKLMHAEAQAAVAETTEMLRPAQDRIDELAERLSALAGQSAPVEAPAPAIEPPPVPEPAGVEVPGFDTISPDEIADVQARGDAAREVLDKAVEQTEHKGNAFALAAAGVGAAALVGTMVFSKPAGPTTRTQHRVIPDDSSQGYNIQVSASDDRDRPTRDYSTMTAAGTGGHLSVRVEDKRDRSDPSSAQAVNALKGR